MPRYKELKAGDKRPPGYEYMDKNDGTETWVRGIKSRNGDVINAEDTNRRDYRILIEEDDNFKLDEPISKFKVGDEVIVIKMGCPQAFYHGSTLEKWKSFGGSKGWVVAVNKRSYGFDIHVRHSCDNANYIFVEDELQLYNPECLQGSQPSKTQDCTQTHPDAAQLQVGMRVRPRGDLAFYMHGSNYKDWTSWKSRSRGINCGDEGRIVSIINQNHIRVKHCNDTYKQWVFAAEELEIVKDEDISDSKKEYPDTDNEYSPLLAGDIRPSEYEYKMKQNSNWIIGDCQGLPITDQDASLADYRIKRSKLKQQIPDLLNWSGPNYPSSITVTISKNKTLKEVPMTNLNAPETELEKTACESAKQDAITRAITIKKEAYQTAMREYISAMTQIKSLQVTMNDLQKIASDMEIKLNITEEQKKQLF